MGTSIGAPFVYNVGGPQPFTEWIGPAKPSSKISFDSANSITFNSLNPQLVEKYSQSFQKVVDYFLTDSGNAGHASYLAEVNFNLQTKELEENPSPSTVKMPVMTIYHAHNNPAQISLANGGAGTSESHARLLELMLHHALLNHDKNPFEAVYNYARLYLMPGDGWSSPQLPDDISNNELSRYPRGMHWAYQITPGNIPPTGFVFANGRPFQGVFGDMGQSNIVYDVFGKPNIAQIDKSATIISKNGVPTIGKYTFGVATDAESWLDVTLHDATVAGVGNYNEDQVGYMPLMTHLMESSVYPGALLFGTSWGGDTEQGWGSELWLGRQLYLGYQNPVLNLLSQNKAQFANVIRLIQDAQNEFSKQTGDKGPFMPVFNEELDPPAFAWDGYDKNVHWMPFQARLIANLADAYSRLEENAPEKTQILPILNAYFSWLSKNTAESSSGELLLPYGLYTSSIRQMGANHPAVRMVNEFKKLEKRDPKLGEVISRRFDVSFYALTAKSLLKMAESTHELKYLKFAESVLTEMAKKQDKDGSTRVIDNNETIPGERYGFMNAEAGSVYAQYVELAKKLQPKP